MQDLDWDDLRFVLGVARSGSLAAAARRLKVNESTVGRRLARSEAKLGARLFERSQGRLVPTEAGVTAAASGERVEREVQSLRAAVAGTDSLAAGLVRITAVPILVNRVLVPALPILLRTHPGLQVDLIADPRDLSLTRRETDIALRMARPRKELRTLARRVGLLEYGVFGPAGCSAEDLPWITYEDAMAGLPQSRWIAEKSASHATPLRATDAESILQAVASGLGKSLLPIPIAARMGGLERLDDGVPALSREIWLLVHPELRDLVRIRVVLEWLAATAAMLSSTATGPTSGAGSRL